jgi:hypothetical protein
MQRLDTSFWHTAVGECQIDDLAATRRHWPLCLTMSRPGRLLRPANFYKWNAKGLEVSDARRLKALEDENTKLKKLSGARQRRAGDVAHLGDLRLAGAS